MLKSWDADNDRWEIYVEDALDPALWDFAFPDEAYEWLKDPEVCLNRFNAVRELSPSFINRWQQFVAQGQVQVACFANDPDPKEGHHPVRPGFRHAAVLGPEGLKDPDGKGSPKSVALPLVPPSEAPPSWEAFPLVSPEFRAACEQLAGLAFGGMFCFDFPVIFPWTEWSNWQRLIPIVHVPYSRRDDLILPAGLEAVEAKLWGLQSNYWGVVTLLREPGHLVQTRDFKVRILEGMTLQEWLAAELARGTQSQNRGFADDSGD